MSVVLFRVIDLETGGLAPPADIIEIGYTDLRFDTDTKEALISETASTLFGATKPLPPENVAVHHLTEAMLAEFAPCDASTVRLVAAGADFLVAANASFEQQWITPDLAPQRWVCTVKAACRLYPDAESHSNQAIRYLLGLDLPEDRAMPPHRAGPDSYVTARILAEMLKTTSVKQLVQWTLEPKFLAKCPLGKWRGTPWSDVETGFLQWIGRTPDLDPDVRHAAAQELQRRKDSFT